MLADDKATKYDLPDEPGEWVRLFPLGFADLDAAVAENVRQARRSASEFAAETYKVVLENSAALQERAAAKKAAPKEKVDPYLTHHTLTLLDRGVAGWSYPAHLPERSADPRVRDERLAALGRLDRPTAEWLARTLLAEAHEPNAWGLDADAIEVEVSMYQGEENPTRERSISY